MEEPRPPASSRAPICSRAGESPWRQIVRALVGWPELIPELRRRASPTLSSPAQTGDQSEIRGGCDFEPLLKEKQNTKLSIQK